MKPKRFAAITAILTALIVIIAAGRARADEIDVNFSTANAPSLGSYHIQYLHSNINKDADLTRGYVLLSHLKFKEARIALNRCIDRREPVFDPRKNTLVPSPTLSKADKEIISEAFTYLAYCSMNEGDLDKAKDYCECAKILNPSNEYAYFYLGNVYLQEGNKTEMRKNLNKTLSLNKEFTTAMRILAESYRDEGDSKNSTSLYKKIVDYLPKSGYYRFQYYRSLMSARDYKGAEKQISAMIKLQPGFMDNYLRRADVYAKEGRYEQALREYDDLLKNLDESDKLVGKVHIGKANTYIEKGDLMEARKEVALLKKLKSAKKIAVSQGEIDEIEGKIDKRAKESRTKLLMIIGLVVFLITIICVVLYIIQTGEKRKKAEAILSDFNEALDKISSVQSLAAFLPEFFAQNLNTITGFLMVYNRQSNTLSTVKSHLVYNTEPITILTTSDVATWTIQESRPIMSLRELLHSKLFEKSFPSLAKRLNELHVGHVIVLKDKNSCVGFVTLGEMNPNSPGNNRNKKTVLDLIEPLTAVSAQTVQTQYLIETSISDELTGLYNKKHLYQSLADELKRADRYRQPCSFCSIDIDDFKYINDTYGLSQGDKILKEIGKIIKANIREGIDIAIRAGGEEFAIILPATTTDLAKMVAERIRATIQNTVFEGFDTHRTITVSFGISTYPDLAISDNDLIQTADAALANAKQTGKNKVCIYDGQNDEEESREEAEKKQEFKMKSGLLSLDSQFEHLNLIDPQTKLPSYAYFSMKMRDEIKRCDRYRLTCSLVIFSIHPDVTEDIKETMMATFTETAMTKYREGIDVATKLNGTTVALLAPETPKEKATALAKRMQYATAAKGLLTASGHPVRTVCAVGSYPECADTGDELLNRVVSAIDIAKVMDTGICVCGSANK